MKIIADTNIFLTVVLNEPEKQRIIELSLGSEIIAPELLPYEMGNALSAMLKRRQLSEVIIKRKDGVVFSLAAKKTVSSPFDIEGINTNISTQEIIEAVRESRQM